MTLRMSFLIRNLSKYNQLGGASARSYTVVVNVFGRKQIDTKAEDHKILSQVPETLEKVQEVSDHPVEHTNERLARIYIPSKNSMQSGTFGLRRWRIEFDHRQRWENPLMGWGSSGDPLTPLHLEFGNREDAVVYCERMGIPYRVDEPQKIKKRIKSYGANFSWDKKTRRTAK